MTTIERYRRWFEYEKDAHLKTLESFSSVPESTRTRKEFQKAIDLLAHLVAARMMWLSRFGVDVETQPPLFSKGAALPDLRTNMESMHKAWSDYLAGLNDSDISKAFEYASSEGPRYRSVIEDVLTQLFGHSLYHRGQIAALIRSLGGEPATTDFIFWTREPL